MRTQCATCRRKFDPAERAYRKRFCNFLCWIMSRQSGRKDRRGLRWRREVLKRDEGTCRFCRSTRNLEVHHITSFADEPTSWKIKNGLTLCRDCHEEVRGREKAWAPFFAAIVSGQRFWTTKGGKILDFGMKRMAWGPIAGP